MLKGSNCATLNGTFVLKTPEFIPFEDPTDFPISFKIRFDEDAGGQYILSHREIRKNKGSWFFYASNTLLRLYLYDTDGVSAEYVDLPRFSIGVDYDVHLHFKDGVLSYSINELIGTEVFPTITEVYNGPLILFTGGYDELNASFKGSFWDLKVDDKNWLASEGALDTLYCNDETHNLVLDGGDLNTLWSKTQDSFHYNFLE